jgi:hypothetical protein
MKRDLPRTTEFTVGPCTQAIIVRGRNKRLCVAKVATLPLSWEGLKLLYRSNACITDKNTSIRTVQ